MLWNQPGCPQRCPRAVLSLYGPGVSAFSPLAVGGGSRWPAGCLDRRPALLGRLEVRGLLGGDLGAFGVSPQWWDWVWIPTCCSSLRAGPHFLSCRASHSAWVTFVLSVSLSWLLALALSFSRPERRWVRPGSVGLSSAGVAAPMPGWHALLPRTTQYFVTFASDKLIFFPRD